MTAIAAAAAPREPRKVGHAERFQCRVEDFHELIETGEWPPRAAVRAGWPTPSAAARNLNRRGLYAEARLIEHPPVEAHGAHVRAGILHLGRNSRR